jgi:hypothetical protein
MSTFSLETSRDTLTLDPETGRLVSLRPLASPGTELLISSPDDPAFVLQYLDASGTYDLLDSRGAQARTVTRTDSVVTFAFTGVGDLDLDVTLTVRAAPSDRFSRWSATVRNGCGLRLVDLQFPFVVVPRVADGAVLLPAGFGELHTGAMQDSLPLDQPSHWQLIPENGNSPHYPGRVFAQFVAWYAPEAGLYLACNDTQGHVKMIRAARRGEGLRLGVAHVGDWPAPGERTLPYEVLLGSFEGDWYDAADLYRDWALQQKWATPLTERDDVPQWLLDSPPHITVRLQGYLDDGPAPPIEEFLPYQKITPLLAEVSERVESPVVAVLMSWERGGPWVYPDCFPPVGGDESLAAFCREARERGWRVGSFCNGTRWVMQHWCNGYDGRAYFEQHDGAAGVCRQSDGSLWGEHWDQSWRPSYITCMAADPTKAIALDFVRRLIGWGMDSIQFFDQNCNAATFPCFSAEHGHPPVPGRWMTQAMEEMIALFRQTAADAGEDAVIQSTECPCNEFCLPLFQQSDVRVSPPSSGFANFVPIYHYLYHECTILHGMMSTGPEPYALPTRNAWNGVWGEIPGAVLTGDGTLLNRETFNWADWEPKVGSNDDSLAMIRSVTLMRRGPGRPFLVYGRMQRPAEVRCDVIEWEHDGHRAVPAVAHAAWRSPSGRHGVVLANWTTEARQATVTDLRLLARASIHTCAEASTITTAPVLDGIVTVDLPPLSCVLLTDDATG